MFEKVANPDKNVSPLEIPKELWLLTDYINQYCTEKVRSKHSMLLVRILIM